ncbi:MAG: hypothetical protein QGH37_31595, partial [Candidatus Poribacteria bacterium]|nr:hypothetical protein [Candidatus Poribacteria bacterium]
RIRSSTGKSKVFHLIPLSIVLNLSFLDGCLILSRSQCRVNRTGSLRLQNDPLATGDAPL